MRRESRIHKALTLKEDPDNELREALINACILAGLSFFTTLAGITAAGIKANPITSILAAIIAAGCTFFSRLAAELGITK